MSKAVIPNFIAAIKSNDRAKLDLGVSMSNQTGIRDEEFKEIADAMKGNNTATEFNCFDTPISPTALRYLVDVLKSHQSITRIGFGANRLGADGTEMLAEILEGNKAITNFCIEGNTIGERGAVRLGQALATHPKATHVTLRRNQISDEVAAVFVDNLGSNSVIKDISLTQNEVGNKGAEAFAEFFKRREKKNFGSLNLANNNVGPEGFWALLQVVRDGEFAVGEMLLEENSVGPDGAVFFANALGANKMKVGKVDIKHNKIGDTGSEALVSALKVNNTVSDIELHDDVSKEFHAEHAMSVEDHLRKVIVPSNRALSRNWSLERYLNPPKTVFKVASQEPQPAVKANSSDNRMPQSK